MIIVTAFSGLSEIINGKNDQDQVLTASGSTSISFRMHAWSQKWDKRTPCGRNGEEDHMPGLAVTKRSGEMRYNDTHEHCEPRPERDFSRR